MFVVDAPFELGSYAPRDQTVSVPQRVRYRGVGYRDELAPVLCTVMDRSLIGDRYVIYLTLLTMDVTSMAPQKGILLEP